LFDPPRNDLTKGGVHSCCDVGKKFCGEMKITLRSGKMLMPQVGGQKRKFGIEILTVSIPAPQGMDGEYVPIIVDPGSLASSCVRNPTLQEQSTKQSVNGP
jgi:hypothetical protein